MVSMLVTHEIKNDFDGFRYRLFYTDDVTV